MTDFQAKKLKSNNKTKAQLKRELNFAENRFDWNNIYAAIFDNCKDNKLQNFQYNFVHRNIATNKYLLKCKYVPSSLCSFCNMAIETLDHQFWECFTIQYFWNKLFDLLSQYNFNDIKNKFHIFLYMRDRLLSYIYMFAKYYIYQCKFKNIIPDIGMFKTKLKNRKTLEHKITLENNRLDILTRSGEGYETCEEARKQTNFICHIDVHYVSTSVLIKLYTENQIMRDYISIK